jgi:hypothetical protein
MLSSSPLARLAASSWSTKSNGTGTRPGIIRPQLLLKGKCSEIRPLLNIALSDSMAYFIDAVPLSLQNSFGLHCNAAGCQESLPPFRGRHARPWTLEPKVVSDRVRRDVAGRAVDTPAIAG